VNVRATSPLVRRGFLAILGGLFVAAGGILTVPMGMCPVLRVEVTVINIDANAPLQAVAVHGCGARRELGTIPPGGRASVRIAPAGECGVSVDYVASGKRVTEGPYGYLEGGYVGSMTFTITATGVKSVKDETRHTL
jgi:hypothetical protein